MFCACMLVIVTSMLCQKTLFLQFLVSLKTNLLC